MPRTRAVFSEAESLALIDKALAGERLDAWSLAQALAAATHSDKVPEEAWRALMGACSPRGQEIAQHPLGFAMAPGSHMADGPADTARRLDTLAAAIEKSEAGRRRFSESFGSEAWVAWALSRPLRRPEDIAGRAANGFGKTNRAFERAATPAMAAHATSQFAMELIEAAQKTIRELPASLPAAERARQSAFFAPWGRALAQTAGLSAEKWALSGGPGDDFFDALDACADLGLFELGGVEEQMREAIAQRAKAAGGVQGVSEALVEQGWPLRKAASQGAGAVRARALIQPSPWRAGQIVNAIGHSQRSERRARAIADSGAVSESVILAMLSMKGFKGAGRAVFEARALSEEIALSAKMEQLERETNATANVNAEAGAARSAQAAPKSRSPKARRV